MKRTSLIVCLIVLIIVCLSGCAGDKPVVVTEINEQLTVDDLIINVNRAKIQNYICGAYNSDHFTLDNGNNFLYVELTVTNNGSEKISFGSDACGYMLEMQNPYASTTNNWKPFFSENISALRRIPGWMEIRGTPESGYYNNVIFAHSNTDNKWIESNETRTFMTAFQTPCSSFDEFTHVLVISKEIKLFKYEEVGHLQLNTTGDSYIQEA